MLRAGLVLSAKVIHLLLTPSSSTRPDMTTLARRLRVAVLLIAVSACASSSAGKGSTGNRNILTQQQMTEQHFLNAYDAIAALRANWLQPRGPDSFNTPSQVWVYMDATRLGDVQTLRAVSVRDIGTIEHLDANAAQARYGIGHGAGAIVISTSPSARPRDP
jgi:hypothetical protein